MPLTIIFCSFDSKVVFLLATYRKGVECFALKCKLLWCYLILDVLFVIFKFFVDIWLYFVLPQCLICRRQNSRGGGGGFECYFKAKLLNFKAFQISKIIKFSYLKAKLVNFTAHNLWYWNRTAFTTIQSMQCKISTVQ